MIDESTIDIMAVDPAKFRQRLPYLQSAEFAKRAARAFARPRSELTRSETAFREALGCSPAELALFLTLLDARQVMDGKPPLARFGGLVGRKTGLTIDLKTAPSGEILDYRLIEPGAAGVNAQETMQ